MPRKTNILSISLPPAMTKAVDELSKQTDQTRSELIRSALREYILDAREDKKRFLEAYKSVRKSKA
jgi:metal-responsive CopG/Arc/MetJ family transcriptional regulator